MKVKGSAILIFTTLLVALCTVISIIMKVNVPYVVLVVIGALLFVSFYLGCSEGERIERNPYWIITVFFVLGVPFLNSLLTNRSIIICIVIISCIGTIVYSIYDISCRSNKNK